MPNTDFAGYVVLVTGASTGLGRAIAVAVAEQGAKAVIVNYARNEAEAAETASSAWASSSSISKASARQSEAARARMGHGSAASVVRASARHERAERSFQRAR